MAFDKSIGKHPIPSAAFAANVPHMEAVGEAACYLAEWYLPELTEAFGRRYRCAARCCRRHRDRRGQHPTPARHPLGADRRGPLRRVRRPLTRHRVEDVHAGRRPAPATVRRHRHTDSTDTPRGVAGYCRCKPIFPGKARSCRADSSCHPAAAVDWQRCTLGLLSTGGGSWLPGLSSVPPIFGRSRNSCYPQVGSRPASSSRVEAGIGKTTLWLAGVTEARERGFRVLSARAGQAETVLTYAALADLLGGVDPSCLPNCLEVQRIAVDRVLLRATADGPSTDESVVAAAFASIIDRMATEAPILVAIDDVQWLDPSSQAVRRSPPAGSRAAPDS